jgi:hypothetical protein
MIRVLAETGIKPICYKIRNSVIRHQDVAREYIFRGKWVKVNPKNWRNRSHTTVRVGTGSGNRREQLGALVQIMGIQEKILANPKQSLVKPAQIYAAANDFAKFSGLPGVGKYLIDPMSPDGQNFAKEIEASNKSMQDMAIREKQIMLDSQTKVANAQQQLVQVESMNVQLKNQNETIKSQLKAAEQSSKAELERVSQQLEQAKEVIRKISADKELAFKYYKADQDYDVALRTLGIESEDSETTEEISGDE